MVSFLSEKTILKVMDRAYVQAIDGMPGVQSADDLAQQFLAREGTLEERVNSLIRWQIAKAATSGFVSGLGGLITMPVSVPANISIVLFVQMRMIAAIAIMGGADVNDDRVKSLVYACMAWNAAKKVLLDIGIDVTTRLALKAIGNIQGKALAAINQQVGFRLLAKFGEKGVSISARPRRWREPWSGQPSKPCPPMPSAVLPGRSSAVTLPGRLCRCHRSKPSRISNRLEERSAGQERCPACQPPFNMRKKAGFLQASDRT